MHWLLQTDICWCVTIKRRAEFPPPTHNKDRLTHYTFLCNNVLINQYIYDSSATRAQIKEAHFFHWCIYESQNQTVEAESRPKKSHLKSDSGSDVMEYMRQNVRASDQ